MIHICIDTHMHIHTFACKNICMNTYFLDTKYILPRYKCIMHAYTQAHMHIYKTHRHTCVHTRYKIQT